MLLIFLLKNNPDINLSCKSQMINQQLQIFIKYLNFFLKTYYYIF